MVAVPAAVLLVVTVATMARRVAVPVLLNIHAWNPRGERVYVLQESLEHNGKSWVVDRGWARGQECRDGSE